MDWWLIAGVGILKRRNCVCDNGFYVTTRWKSSDLRRWRKTNPYLFQWNTRIAIQLNTAGKTAMSEYRGDSANVNWKGCVCKKKENRNTVGEQEWCLAMREARKRNSSHEPYFSRNQRHIPGWESPFRERVSLLVRFKSWEVPSKMMTRGLENVFVSPTAVREVSLGKSIHQFISSSPLRIVSTVDSS